MPERGSVVPQPRDRSGVAGPDAGLGRGPRRRLMGGSGQQLVDLLDRLVDTGAVVSADVVVALAGVDLLRIDLRLLLVGVQTALEDALEDAEEAWP